MEPWNALIDTALLGTSRRPLSPEALPPALRTALAMAPQATAEESFLQAAALLYNYRQCGLLPLRDPEAQLAPANPEELPYIGDAARKLLHAVLETGSAALLHLFLDRCSAAGQIVGPDVIPVLLDAALKDRSLRPPVFACCGARGAWLRSLNPEWKKMGEPVEEEDPWETGSLDQRREWLRNLRATDPAAARTHLQAAWPQENAAARAALLSALAINIGDDDLPWLTGLAGDKSVKVRDEVLALLKLVSGSELVQRYRAVLSRSVQIQVSRGVLGIGGKTTVSLQLTGMEEELYKTGIESLSGTRDTSDEQFVLYQLAASVPPSFWAEQLERPAEEAIALLAKEKATAFLLPAIATAALRFRDADWLRPVLAQDQKSLYSDAWLLLPQPEAEHYSTPRMKGPPGAELLQAALAHSRQEWGLPFATAVLRTLSADPYNYGKPFYSGLLPFLPAAAAPVLQALRQDTARHPYSAGAQQEYLLHLLGLKEQIQQHFNA
ncbi:DUF5691 domain-containing protein [Flaviaesturariibacter amylovorans]|uniref:HEAT repeat domain-containing protein n=1 Tax=Flaviaesturariibacter amylovorans TaxID=1084520 RepID=A0ABP8H0D5_9BACT